MHSKRRLILLIFAAVLVAALALWRLWPRSLSSVISVDKADVTSVACTAVIARNGNGYPYIDTYTLSNLSPTDPGFAEILDILDSSGYRPDLRNLLPWAPDTVASGANYDGRSVNLLLVWGSGETDSCSLSFHGPDKVAVGLGTSSGFSVYHPAERGLLDGLIEYIKAHGE